MFSSPRGVSSVASYPTTYYYSIRPQEGVAAIRYRRCAAVYDTGAPDHEESAGFVGCVSVISGRSIYPGAHRKLAPNHFAFPVLRESCCCWCGQRTKRWGRGLRSVRGRSSNSHLLICEDIAITADSELSAVFTREWQQKVVASLRRSMTGSSRSSRRTSLRACRRKPSFA